MAWPTTAVVTGDPVLTSQLNGLPVQIANTTLGADAASIDFSSIPGHYAHLMVEVYARSSFASPNDNLVLTFNGDTAGNYDYQLIYGIAATVTATEALAQPLIFLGNVPANTGGANLFGGDTVTIMHYANTANNKCLISKCAQKTGTTSSSLRSMRAAGFWRSNAAITQMTFSAQNGDLKSGSRATLYGLPG